MEVQAPQYELMYKANTDEELHKAYRVLMSKYHPDNHIGEASDEDVIVTYGNYCKQIVNLYETLKENLQAGIKVQIKRSYNRKAAPETQRKDFIGPNYDNKRSMAEVVKLVKEFLKKYNSDYMTFSCYSKGKTLYLYISKGIAKLEGYKVLNDNVLFAEDYAEALESSMALYLILYYINTLRYIKVNNEVSFNVHLSIGKDVEHPYHYTKSKVYERRDASYYSKRLEEGTISFLDIPRRYKTKGMAYMVIVNCSVAEASIVITGTPNIIDEACCNAVLKYKPELFTELPKEYYTIFNWKKLVSQHPEYKTKMPEDLKTQEEEVKYKKKLITDVYKAVSKYFDKQDVEILNAVIPSLRNIKCTLREAASYLPNTFVTKAFSDQSLLLSLKSHSVGVFTIMALFALYNEKTGIRMAEVSWDSTEMTWK